MEKTVGHGVARIYISAFLETSKGRLVLWQNAAHQRTPAPQSTCSQRAKLTIKRRVSIERRTRAMPRGHESAQD